MYRHNRHFLALINVPSGADIEGSVVDDAVGDRLRGWTAKSGDRAPVPSWPPCPGASSDAAWKRRRLKQRSSAIRECVKGGRIAAARLVRPDV